MRLIRFGEPGREKPGLLLPDDTRIDAGGFGMDWNEAFFGGDGMARLADWLRTKGPSAPRVPAGVRLGPAIARPSKIICIGLNYKDHARETKAQIPEEPILFFKSTSSLSGPNDDLLIPRGGTKVDWEVELGVVIGRLARYVPRESALEHVAGFVLHNDYSERAFQLERKGQWVKGKSCDSFAPVGPWLLSRDEAPDWNRLRLWCRVNGETMQDGNTAEMAYDVPTLVSYVSQFMTLLPGDLISTGTPAGVALGMETPRWLQPGDVVECGVDRLGSNRQTVRQDG